MHGRRDQREIGLTGEKEEREREEGRITACAFLKKKMEKRINRLTKLARAGNEAR